MAFKSMLDLVIFPMRMYILKTVLLYIVCKWYIYIYLVSMAASYTGCNTLTVTGTISNIC